MIPSPHWHAFPPEQQRELAAFVDALTEQLRKLERPMQRLRRRFVRSGVYQAQLGDYVQAHGGTTVQLPRPTPSDEGKILAIRRVFGAEVITVVPIGSTVNGSSAADALNTEAVVIYVTDGESWGRTA